MSVISEVQDKSQSDGLRERHKALHDEGKHLCIDSSESESTLKQAMKSVLEYAKAKVEEAGGTIVYKTSISLFECQEIFHKAGGPKPNEANGNVFMRPDGGIIFASFDGILYPILIGEDKVQGTNDSRKAEGKPKQALGNAIERAAKNIRGCEMLCANMTVFPYVIFASGCDFHHSETISKRLEMMNFGKPNHYFEVRPDKSQEEADAELQREMENIEIEKVLGHGLASVFIKSHKWDAMSHGSSRWKTKEITNICKVIISKALKSISR